MFFFSFFISVSTEFILDSTMSNAAGFQYFGGPYVTVLSSKTSQRHSISKDSFRSSPLCMNGRLKLTS